MQIIARDGATYIVKLVVGQLNIREDFSPPDTCRTTVPYRNFSMLRTDCYLQQPMVICALPHVSINTNQESRHQGTRFNTKNNAKHVFCNNLYGFNFSI